MSYVITKTKTIAVAAGLALAVLAAAPGVAPAGGPRSTPRPADADCSAQGGTFGWNRVWRLDTTMFPEPVGYLCQFSGPAGGGSTTEATILASPGLAGARAVCERRYAGTFYTFEDRTGPEPDDVSYAGYGCEWLASLTAQ